MTLRKSIVITIVSILALSLVGCKGKKSTQEELNSFTVVSPVKYEEIQLVDFKISEPENGEKEGKLEARFRNNSKEIISHIEFTYEVNGKQYYLTSFETLKPGRSSDTKYTSIDTENIDDMKLSSVSIDIEKNDYNMSIIYDTESKEYTVDVSK